MKNEKMKNEEKCKNEKGSPSFLSAIAGVTVEQSKKMVPSITREPGFRQHVLELVLGFNTFDLDFGVQVDSVKLPVQRNSVGSGFVSHRRTSAFSIRHLEYCFIVNQKCEARHRCDRVCAFEVA